MTCFINGETLVTADGSELGLSDADIPVAPQFKYLDVTVNAWGEVPPEVQWMLGTVSLSFTLVHFDPAIVDYCLQKSMGGPSAVGQMARAGTRLGKPGNFVKLRFTSPVGGKPWTFPNCHMTDGPLQFPLGTDRSVIRVNFRAVPFILDPYNSGNGATNYALWTYT